MVAEAPIAAWQQVAINKAAREARFQVECRPVVMPRLSESCGFESRLFHQFFSRGVSASGPSRCLLRAHVHRFESCLPCHPNNLFTCPDSSVWQSAPLVWARPRVRPLLRAPIVFSRQQRSVAQLVQSNRLLTGRFRVRVPAARPRRDPSPSLSSHSTTQRRFQ